MSPERRRRPLTHRPHHFRDTSLVIIATEGECTETVYFDELFGSKSSRVQVKVLPTKNGRSAPEHLLQRLDEFKAEYHLEDTDQLWYVGDTDRWGDKKLHQVTAECIQKKVHLAISRPCFELWLLLHLVDVDPENHQSKKQIEAALRKALGGSYNKSRLDVEPFENTIEAAVSRAKGMDNEPKARWPNITGSHVYRLIEALQRFEIDTP